MLLTKRKLTLVLGLTLLVGIADFFGTFGFVWAILKLKLGVGQYFADFSELVSGHAWLRFLQEQGILLLAAASIFASFSLGKREGKQIFAIAQTLFPRSKTPKAVGELSMAILAPVTVFGFLLNLFLMAYFIENVAILSLLLAVVYILSMVGNKLQRDGLLKHLGDSRFAPTLQSDDYHYIMKSRTIVSGYLFENYHQTRELMALSCCLAVAVLSWRTSYVPVWTYYLLISGLVLLNELVVYIWRNKRDVALLTLES